MAVSGSKDFEPNVADYVEEAFERCGLEFRTGYDAVTARRSGIFFSRTGPIAALTAGQSTKSVRRLLLALRRIPQGL